MSFSIEAMPGVWPPFLLSVCVKLRAITSQISTNPEGMWQRVAAPLPGCAECLKTTGDRAGSEVRAKVVEKRALTSVDARLGADLVFFGLCEHEHQS